MQLQILSLFEYVARMNKPSREPRQARSQRSAWEGHTRETWYYSSFALASLSVSNCLCIGKILLFLRRSTVGKRWVKAPRCRAAVGGPFRLALQLPLESNPCRTAAPPKITSPQPLPAAPASLTPLRQIDGTKCYRCRGLARLLAHPCGSLLSRPKGGD